MRSSLVVMVLAVACTKTSERAQTTSSAGSAGSAAVAVKPVAVKPVAVKDGIAIPADHPTSDILVTNHCSLSPHPPSTFYWSQSTVYDLQARTWTSTRTEGHDNPQAPPRPRATQPGDPDPPDPNAPKVTTTNGTLPPERIRTITTHLVEVLSGGPYPPKYPYSGGSRCTLILTGKGQDKPFFSIDRADNETDDAVTRLMTAL